MKLSPRSPSGKSPLGKSPSEKATGMLSRLEKLRAKHNDIRKSAGAELVKSKERLSRERMAQSQDLNWYSQRFNESGRTFYMDASSNSDETFKNNSNISHISSEKNDCEKLPLEKIRERHNNVKKATGAELAKSKERLARARMMQSQDLNWYSQRFNESGRTFHLDPSDSGDKASNKNKIKPVKKLSLEKLPEQKSPVKQAAVATPAKSKERLVRERMAESQGLNWYSQRFNESGRRFYIDTSDGGGNASNKTKSKPVEKLSSEKVTNSPIKQAAVAAPAKSKERLVRERMAESQGLNWYSQRFNQSGRRFYVDDSDTGGDSSNIQPVAKKVPLHVALIQENEKLRRKLEKTESDRKLLKKRVSKISVPNADKAILKTKLLETKAQYSNLKVELNETKNELSAKEAATLELMEKMKEMKKAYDTLARQMQSRRGSFSAIPDVVDIEELQTAVKDLKHENKRLLLEKEISMRHSFGPPRRLGSISENHFNEAQFHENDNTMYESDLSTTAADLTNAEIKVAKAGEEIKDTQNALDHAQSLIEKLKWEKQNLAKKMQDQLNKRHMSHVHASHRSTLESSQRSPQLEISPSRKKPRALSMAMKEVSIGSRIGADAPFDYELSEVDVSEKSRRQEELNNFIHDNDGVVEIHPDRRRKWKRTASALNQDLRALNSQDLNIVNQTSIFLTSLLLICGFPLLALTCSAGSIFIYGYQKDSTLPFHKDVQKYFLINCSGAVMSFGSWSLMAQAMADPSQTLNFVFATLLREFSGFVLAWFIYTDYNCQDEPEALDIVEVKVKIHGGRDLVAKDKNFFGKAKSSDPYVRIYHARNFIGRTQVVWKTLNPTWSRASFTIMAVPSVLETHDEVICHIYDHDTLSADDSMGTVIVPIPQIFNETVRKWYPVTNGSGDDYCRNATGHLDVEIVVLPGLSNELKSRLGRRSSFNYSTREICRNSIENREILSHEGVQSLGEITAETKFPISPQDAAVVVKI